MKRLGFILGLCLCLTACETTTQTTSGEAYLARHGESTTAEKGSFEDQLRQAARVEPTLNFPARIGLARIDGGQLIAVPGAEAQAWQAVREHLGNNFGEFVPINPLVAKLASQAVNYNNAGRGMETINQIRLGAARQHLDAVLIYEAYSKTDTKSTILSIADLTIVGAYLVPSKVATSQGFATALLIDVMQGYPYGTAQVTTDKETKLSTRWGWGSKDGWRDGDDEEKTKAVFALAPEVEAMLQKLQIELEAKHKKQRESKQ
jgi:hypothetical protein